MNVASRNDEKIDQEREQLRQDMMPIFSELDKYDIIADKIKTVIGFTVEFYAKHRKHMSFQRMTRKVVEHFHLKVKDEKK